MRDNLIRMNRVGFTPALFYYNKTTREACRRLFYLHILDIAYIFNYVHMKYISN